jgi:hypothetical protein
MYISKIIKSIHHMIHYLTETLKSNECGTSMLHTFPQITVLVIVMHTIFIQP